jgi:hypothetical protein
MQMHKTVHTTCIFSFKNQAPVQHPATPFTSWRSLHTLHLSNVCPYDKRKTASKVTEEKYIIFSKNLLNL